MARDVLEKARNGESLDDDDMQYARSRPWVAEQLKSLGIEVPVAQHQRETDFGTPTDGLLVQTGPQFVMPDQASSGPGLFLSEADLENLKADTLDEIAEAVGVEVPRKKADKVATLVGAETSGSDEDESDEEEQGL